MNETNALEICWGATVMLGPRIQIISTNQPLMGRAPLLLSFLLEAGLLSTAGAVAHLLCALVGGSFY